MSAPIAFVDCETTGLDPARHHVWEIAVIRRRADGVDCEYLWQIRPDLTTAEPEALKIGRYEERFAVPDGFEAIEMFESGPPFRTTLPEVLFDLQDALKDAVIVGSNPGFDVAFLTALLRAHGRKLPWHYRPVDISTLAAGRLYGVVGLVRGALGDETPKYVKAPTLPFSSRSLSRAVGVEPPGDGVAHTALGDARWARDVFDAVTGGGA
ncbi:3'-5' exonuclease [Streptomyces sp. C1-2]|uniref:3'-5' exonuclease n=1 Tax=Streptomyces sp. C1-2 TaxID=2720022 RepID=UPI0014323E1C|nr:3'-5' exonuclease [Streptomyces sp. C1-2]NJP70409.1 3'-5' exonuclease [Streptomyces sp. C1-2]